MVKHTVFFNIQKKRIVSSPRVPTPRAKRQRPGQGAGAGAEGPPGSEWRRPGWPPALPRHGLSPRPLPRQILASGIAETAALADEPVRPTGLGTLERAPSPGLPCALDQWTWLEGPRLPPRGGPRADRPAPLLLPAASIPEVDAERRSRAACQPCALRSL
nr:40S ribosomal protein S27-like isoform X1 [Chlorocebus sabaeus]